MKNINFYLLLLLAVCLQPVWAITDSSDATLAKAQHMSLEAKPDLQLTDQEQLWLQEHKEITIAFDGNYAPYSFQNKQGAFNGIAVDFARELARRAGIKFNVYMDGTWNGLYSAAQQRKVDVIATLVQRPERQQWFNFSKPYISLAQYVITTKSNKTITTREQIAGQTIALVKAYSTSRYLLEEFPTVKAYYVDTLSQALEAVATGKAEATVAAMGMAQHLIAQQGIADLKFTALFAQGLSEQRFGVRNDWPELASILDKALASLSENERLQIFQRWSHPQIAHAETVMTSTATVQWTEQERVWLKEHPQIRIGTMKAWPPMDFVDLQGKPQGVGASFIDVLNLRLNGALKIVPGSWSAILNGLKDGQLDALMGITPSTDRQAFFHFTRPYVMVPHVIFSRDDDIAYSNLNALKGKRVAVEQDFFIVKVLRDKYPEIVIKEYDTTSEALDSVSRGESHAYVGNRAVATFIIENELIANLRQGGKIRETSSINAIGVRKDSLILKQILQKALDSLTYQERRLILQKWGASPEPMKFSPEERAWLAEHRKIRVGVMDAWPPFNFLDKDGVARGIGADYIAALNQRLEGALEIVPGQWNKLYEDVKQRRLDVLMDLTPKPEREEYFNFTTPYLDIPHVIVARAGTKFIANESELAGKTLALERGFGNVKYFRENFPQVNLKEYPDTSHALGAVSRGEADAYAGNRGVALYLITREVISNLQIHGRLKKKGSVLAFGTRKDWPVLNRILQKALDDISHEEQQKIISSWTATDEKAPLVVLTSEEKAWLAAHPVIRTGTDRDWAPVEFIDDEGKFQGISSDYISKLEQILGIKFDIANELSWQESIAAFERGELDLITSLRRTAQRERVFDFTDSYTSFPIAIFTGPEVHYIGSMQELNERKVGAIKGHAIQELLTENYPDIKLVTTSDTVDALDKLSRGEIDAYVGNTLVTGYYIGQLGYTHIKVVGETPYRYEQSMGVRKNWPVFAGILNKALAAIPENERTNISNRWIGVRYEYGFDYSLLWKVLAVVFVILALFLYWNYRLSQLNKQLVIARNQEQQAKQAAQQARITVEQANTQLKQLDKLKSMFIASMSHELRTPLNSIIGFSGLLIQGILGELNDKQKDSMERIHRSGNHLLGLISDVIDISKIEAGRIDAFPEPFVLRELLEEALETVRPQADAKGLALELIADNLPQMNTDRKRLLQCLLNYLSNAVKFSETGKVTLAVNMSGDMLKLSVSDTGIGISKEDMSKLFEAFERLETHLRVKAGGTGLGLYLTKKITEELLHGTVSVESYIDEGSTFTLKIPVDATIVLENDNDSG